MRRRGLRCPGWTHNIANCVVSLKQFDSSVKHPGWRGVKKGTVVRVLNRSSPVLALTRGAVDLTAAALVNKVTTEKRPWMLLMSWDV